MWSRNSDLTYVANMSEFARTPLHPETDGRVSYEEFKRCLKPDSGSGEIRWWYGVLDTGARVLIYND